ncbi:NAD(P)-binding domain-containing protein [Thalassotalea sp. PS06]|uniref:NAD(P)-binding domain-containing protein n=1 Tax=Thalassotalea sp. PS06 TaxID=2594005 RepID=UPI00163DA924|nr:NAD(P)H-binding protein [Thalassotalea sp. PS06]
MTNKTVTIIGAGWLGLPLAEHLTTLGHQVLVTATSPEKVSSLRDTGLNAVEFKASDAGDISGLLSAEAVYASEVMIICIPPRIRHGEDNYPQIITQLVSAAESQSIQLEHIIMCSSTAVYNGLSGRVDEQSELNLQAPKVAIMAKAEQAILNSQINDKQVLRLGGLIGPNRHPGRFFREGRVIPNPDSVINFIHQQDVIEIISEMINKPGLKSQPVINGVSPNHPSRQTFYEKAHQVLGREMPAFSPQAEDEGKQVIPKVLEANNHRFHYPELMTWLETSTDLPE